MRLIIITILSATLFCSTVHAQANVEMENNLKEAQARYDANPKNADAIIWLGRRLAYLGRFKEAIDTYTKGIALHPSDARFYRHRGHRHITLRQFDLAIRDLRKASQLIKGKPDEIEPDGQPNERNIPTSTLQFNIWYHLGLAYYLTAQNDKALSAYRECLKVSGTPDRLVSTTHWLYMTLRRLNRNAEAAKAIEPIVEGMDIIENTSYYRLTLMYKGILFEEQLMSETQGDSPASHSVLYGIGNWHLYNGRLDQGLEIFRRILTSNQKTSFGFIAAEADLKRFNVR